MNQLLTTETTVTRIGNFISIYTKYVKGLKNILAFISNKVQSINGVNFIEGEGGITKKGYNEVEFYLNNNGDLIVVGENVDRFSINSNGDLTVIE